MQKNAIVWFRNDLRLSDNAALSHASSQNYHILFLYIYDPNYHIGAAAQWFLHQALASLAKDIKDKYKTNLIIESGNPQQVLEKVAKQYKIESIFWNRVYEPYTMQRDSAIKKHFQDKQFTVKSFNSSLLIEPGQFKNLSGSYYKVFTPFWKNCLKQIENTNLAVTNIDSIQTIQIPEDPTNNLNQLGLEPSKPNWAKGWDNIYKVSESRAQTICEDFIQQKVHNYKIERDHPNKPATSGLSPYLHFGLISPKQIYLQTLSVANNDSVQQFISEIGWREFSYYLLYHFPKLANTNFNSKFNKFAWENNPDHLKKWQTGKTGYPIVDAGMRQLWQTGWMHNRVRMIVASFLTKNLLIDWRLGAEWFSECLVDADLAANSASWQWVAGSGADSAPYFRIFNPISQSQKFDPQGDYLRRWLPELKDLNAKEIHIPTIRKNYPEPIVDLKISRQRALDNYQLLKS